MIVCLTQSRDIEVSGFSRLNKAYTPPGKAGTLQINGQEVSCNAGVSAVAVREWMDGDEPVMEAHGNFIRGIGLMLNPIPDIIERMLEIRADTPCINTYVLAGSPVFSGPLPDIL